MREQSRKVFAEEYLPATFIVILTLIAFNGVLDGTFIIFDDPEYITENVKVLSGLSSASIRWAFTSLDHANWHPLTWLSHQLDVQFFGLNPTGHHLTSLVLHTVNSGLLMIVLYRMTGAMWRSFAVASLFAIHPLHVESVAWLAERKDVLSGLFFILTLWSYERYIRSPKLSRYLLVLLCFSLGLMAKAMLVTVPLLLLLLDYWPLQRIARPAGTATTPPWRHLLYEKIPLAVLSLAAALITYVAQRSGNATPALDQTNHLGNVSNGMLSYARYLLKLLWPHDLAIFYPRGDSSFLMPALITMVLVTSGVLLFGTKYPCLVTGWFWFILGLLPVIGFVRIGSAAMADRYTYLPAIGIFMMVCWLTGEFINRLRIPALPVALLFCTVIITLSLLTARQVRHWHNSYTLFEHATRVTQNNWLAYNNLASAYLLQAHNDKGINLTRYLCGKNGCPDDDATRTGCLTKAVAAAQAAIRSYPDYTAAYFNLGLAYRDQGNTQAAREVVNKLLFIDTAQAGQLAAIVNGRP